MKQSQSALTMWSQCVTVGVFSSVVNDRKALLDGLLGGLMGRRVRGSMAYGALSDVWDRRCCLLDLIHSTSNRKHNTSSQLHCLRHYGSD